MLKPGSGVNTEDQGADNAGEEQIECAEDQPLRTLSRESLNFDIKDFTSSYNLTNKFDVFKKAAALYLGEQPEDIPNITSADLEALGGYVSNKWHQPKLLYFTIFVCSIGAIEQGWAQTAMNGANLYFPSTLGIGTDSALDAFILGLINGGIYLSVALWGAWLSSPLNARLGRRGAIFTGSALCLVANLGSAISWSWPILLFFRLLLGTGMGINASTVSVFAAECAPASIRGALAVSWQMWVAFGIFLGFVANVAVYDFGPDTIWRLQLGAPFVPTVPLLCMIHMCPESSAWFVKTGRYDLAFQSLSRLRNAEILAAKEVYASYVHAQSHSSSQKHLYTQPKPAHSSSHTTKLTELFTTPRFRHATFAAYAVMLSQIICGINIISFFSSTIFATAGFTDFQALIASTLFGLTNFLFAFPAIWTMDSLGRRSLLLYTLPPMALTLLLTGLTFRLPEGQAQLWLLAGLIYLFCALYSPGMGPVPPAYCAEVFPLSHREIGMSFAIATVNGWAAVLSVTFPALLGWLGSEGAFELYSGLNMVAWALCWVFVRETKRMGLEELDGVFGEGVGSFVWARGREVRRMMLRSGESAAMVYSELEQEDDVG